MTPFRTFLRRISEESDEHLLVRFGRYPYIAPPGELRDLPNFPEKRAHSRSVMWKTAGTEIKFQASGLFASGTLSDPSNHICHYGTDGLTYRICMFVLANWSALTVTLLAISLKSTGRIWYQYEYRMGTRNRVRRLLLRVS